MVSMESRFSGKTRLRISLNVVGPTLLSKIARFLASVVIPFAAK